MRFIALKRSLPHTNFEFVKGQNLEKQTPVYFLKILFANSWTLFMKIPVCTLYVQCTVVQSGTTFPGLQMLKVCPSRKCWANIRKWALPPIRNHNVPECLPPPHLPINHVLFPHNKCIADAVHYKETEDSICIFFLTSMTC